MDMIRTQHSQKSGRTKAPVIKASAPHVNFSGVILLVSGLSVSLITAMTGFTLAMVMIWPG